MNSFSRDAGIPLLTEIIATPPVPGIATAADLHAPGLGTTYPAEAEAEAGSTSDSALSRDEFDRLADIVLERVLAQLQNRFDSLLGVRLETRLSEQLTSVAAGLATEIRRDVRHELEDLIAATRARGSNDANFTEE